MLAKYAEHTQLALEALPKAERRKLERETAKKRREALAKLRPRRKR